MGAETYEWSMVCSNCFKFFTINIPKGTTVDEYLGKGVVCSNCGVRYTKR